MVVLIAKYLIPRGFRGYTVFPFIVLGKKVDKSDAVLLHHERIHLRQQSELLILPFFIWYGIEFFIRLLQYRNKHKAYLNISFEREAYDQEFNKNYFEERKFWAFLKYL